MKEHLHVLGEPVGAVTVGYRVFFNSVVIEESGNIGDFFCRAKGYEVKAHIIKNPEVLRERDIIIDKKFSAVQFIPGRCQWNIFVKRHVRYFCSHIWIENLPLHRLKALRISCCKAILCMAVHFSFHMIAADSLLVCIKKNYVRAIIYSMLISSLKVFGFQKVIRIHESNVFATSLLKPGIPGCCRTGIFLVKSPDKFISSGIDIDHSPAVIR